MQEPPGHDADGLIPTETEGRDYLTPDVEGVQWNPPGWVLDDLGVEPERVLRFLSHLATTGNVSLAVRRARVGRATVYRLREKDPTFVKAWSDALKCAQGVLEAEAYRRAVVGVTRPVFQGGVKVGEIREYSDELLKMMLRVRHPAYRKALNAQPPGTVVDARSVTVNVGPTPPNGEALSQWAERLAEIARNGAPRLNGEATE